jgi:hypothetical protein
MIEKKSMQIETISIEKSDQKLLMWSIVRRMLVPFLLLYTAVTRVNTVLNFYRFGSFGFESNSTFHLRFSEIGSGHLLYGLFTQDEFDTYPMRSFPVADLCSASTDFPSIRRFLGDRDEDLRGTISDPGVYYQVVANCDDPETIQIKTVVTIEQQFRNPSTHLDIRWRGATHIKCAFLWLCGGILVLWCVNWSLHCSWRILLHDNFTVFLWLLLAVETVRYFELRRLDGDDVDGGLTVLRVVGRVAYQTYFAAFATAAAKGWCILTNEFPLSDVLWSVGCVGLSSVAWILPDFVSLHSHEVITGMLSVLGGSLFLKDVLHAAGGSMMHSWAHLIAIGRAEINPRTTPVYERYTIFRSFRWSAVVGAGVIYIMLVLSLFINIPYRVTEGCNDALRLLLGGCWAWIFRIRDEDVNGRYGFAMQLEDCEPLSIESMDLRSRVLIGGGSTWRPGMSLPGEPKVRISEIPGRIRADSLDINNMVEDLSLDD